MAAKVKVFQYEPVRLMLPVLARMPLLPLAALKDVTPPLVVVM